MFNYSNTLFNSKRRKMMKLKNITFILGMALICLPIHISYGQGARYTGTYTKSSAIQYNGKSNFVIEGLEITSGDKYLIVLYNCENVIIRNNKFGPTPSKLAIYLDGCKNVTVVDNTFENVQTGMVAHKSQSIKFDYNDLTNVVGPLKGGGNIGNLAMFDKVSGAGNSISYNVCENFAGESAPEDIINVNQSHGTSSSPIMVKGNWLRGGGPSASGGGIILGDLGGSYQVAEDNIVVNGGQYGMSIAGGNNITMRNNKIFSSRQSYNNVGLYAVNWYAEAEQSHSITVSNNLVNYTNASGQLNNWWFGNNMGTITGQSTNKYDASLNASVLPDKIIGRAGTSVTPDPTPAPAPTPAPTPTPTPTPTNPGTGDDNEVAPGITLPDIDNHPSIKIYTDKYMRVCVNISGSVSRSATVYVATATGENVGQQTLNRYHTVLGRPSPGKYIILVQNGQRAHLKVITVS